MNFRSDRGAPARLLCHRPAGSLIAKAIKARTRQFTPYTECRGRAGRKGTARSIRYLINRVLRGRRKISSSFQARDFVAEQGAKNAHSLATQVIACPVPAGSGSNAVQRRKISIKWGSYSSPGPKFRYAGRLRKLHGFLPGSTILFEHWYLSNRDSWNDAATSPSRPLPAFAPTGKFRSYAGCLPLRIRKWALRNQGGPGY